MKHTLEHLLGICGELHPNIFIIGAVSLGMIYISNRIKKSNHT